MNYLYRILPSAAIFLMVSCTVNEQTDELETTWLFWVILAAVIVGLIAGFNQNKKDEAAKQDRGEKFRKASEEFHVSAKVVGVNNHYQFIVDDVDKNIIYMESTWKKKIVSFDKIMSVEMIEDNTMISSKSLGRTIGGALIGDLVAGGAGMIVGGLSGNSKQKKKVSKVEVVIKMRDFNDTALRIPCFEVDRETSKTKKEIKPEDSIYGPMYKKGLEDAIKITELISIIIDQMDKTSANSTANSTVTVTSQNSPITITKDIMDSSVSIADEIKKLADMRAQGLISDEEFASLKSQLID